MINISKIINNKNLNKNLAYTIQQISTVYTLTKTIRSNIFNREQFIKTLVTKDILDNINNLLCNCTASPFPDPKQGHIVTGDISVFQNNKLRKLICKDSKYKEQSEIKNSLTKFSSDWCNKRESLSNALHNGWKSKVRWKSWK